MTADDKLNRLGFKLVKRDDNIGFLIYENRNADHRVELDLSSSEWVIHSTSISLMTDWYGQGERRPMGLMYDECEAFLLKIKELVEESKRERKKSRK